MPEYTLPPAVPGTQVLVEPTGPTIYVFPIDPVAKPRMTRRDQWLTPPRKCVSEYRTFCDYVRLYMGRADLNESNVRFEIPMPSSWSKKKKAELKGKPHQQKPDLSNLLKALEDALYSERHTGRDDSEIHAYCRVEKVWSDKGAIVISWPDGQPNTN